MVKKRTTGILFFFCSSCIPAFTIHFFSQKQQLPFTPGGTHCPEPDVTLRDLTLSPATTVIMPLNPFRRWTVLLLFPPTNENTSPPEDTPDNTPAGGNTGQAEKTRNAGLTPIPEKRSGMPPELSAVCHGVSIATEDCRSQRKADAHRASG